MVIYIVIRCFLILILISSVYFWVMKSLFCVICCYDFFIVLFVVLNKNMFYLLIREWVFWFVLVLLVIFFCDYVFDYDDKKNLLYFFVCLCFFVFFCGLFLFDGVGVVFGFVGFVCCCFCLGVDYYWCDVVLSYCYCWLGRIGYWFGLWFCC